MGYIKTSHPLSRFDHTANRANCARNITLRLSLKPALIWPNISDCHVEPIIQLFWHLWRIASVHSNWIHFDRTIAYYSTWNTWLPLNGRIFIRLWYKRITSWRILSNSGLFHWFSLEVWGECVCCMNGLNRKKKLRQSLCINDDYHYPLYDCILVIGYSSVIRFKCRSQTINNRIFWETKTLWGIRVCIFILLHSIDC